MFTLPLKSNSWNRNAVIAKRFEMNLIMFCYNFIRTKNILVFEKMIRTIQNWQPNYDMIVCALKFAFIKAFATKITRSIFIAYTTRVFKACNIEQLNQPHKTVFALFIY